MKLRHASGADRQGVGGQLLESRDATKARGGFYTPLAIAAFLANWGVRRGVDRVLEPSAGDGSVVRAVISRFGDFNPSPGVRVVAIEPEPKEADKCRQIGSSVRVLQRDFFAVLPEDAGTIDAVLGNPPYIRYQRWTGSARESSQKRARDMGVELSAQSSSWAAFVIHSCQFLAEDGRLGLVLPLELRTSDYAEAVRQYLPRRFASVTVLAIDEPVFEGASVATVLLLASGDGPPGLRVQRIARSADLGAWLEHTEPDTPAFALASTTSGPSTTGRWAAALDRRAAAVYDELRASGRLIALGHLASVDIGEVTGADAFFVLEPALADALGLRPEQQPPIVRRPAALGGLATRAGETARLLCLPKVEAAVLPESLRAYIQGGETAGLNLRYKCSRRKPWFALRVPRRRPDAFFRYMNHDAARLVANEIGALSTNLLHAVRLRSGAPDPRALAAAMLSGATRLSAELEGRSYGGGVLKLETREAERVQVVVLNPRQEQRLLELFPKLDELLRRGELESASALVDHELEIDHDVLLSAAKGFGGRRMARSRGERRAKGGESRC